VSQENLSKKKRLKKAMSVNVRDLREHLRTNLGLGADTLFLMPEESMHQSLYIVQDPRFVSVESQMTDEEERAKLSEIYRSLEDVGDFRITFDRIVVTETGDILLFNSGVILY